MPLIERKTLDRLNSDDILYQDVGNLVKAGNPVGNSVPSIAKFKVAVIPVIAPSKEERNRYVGQDLDELVMKFIQKRNNDRFISLRMRLRDTLMSLYVPFGEKDQSFSLPGKKGYISENDLLTRKIDRLIAEQVTIGSSRMIDKYKLKFCVDILTQIQSSLDKLKPFESGQKEQPGCINRAHYSSVRLSSWFDEDRFRTMGDCLVNQAVDMALMYLHTFMNINKKRIINNCPLSESRYDSKQKKSLNGIYQYKPELILEASLGALLSNLGYAHQTIHKIISHRPILQPDDPADKKAVKQIQKGIYVLKHLLDRDDISSISRMLCSMQKDFPDGSGFPAPNENKFLFEFVRLFQIVSFYDRMTNPVLSRTSYSRMDVIEYMIQNSGEYNHSSEKFEPQPLFDAGLLEEFLGVLAPFELHEKVYLYSRGNHSQHLFVGKVVSYPDSHIPLIAILKDEKNGREYRDGSLFMHIPSSSLYLKNESGRERKVFPWIKELVIFDRKTDPGAIDEYRDEIFGGYKAAFKEYQVNGLRTIFSYPVG